MRTASLLLALAVATIALYTHTATAGHTLYKDCKPTSSVYSATCTNSASTSSGSICDDYRLSQRTSLPSVGPGIYGPAVCGVVEAVPGQGKFDLAVFTGVTGDVSGWNTVTNVTYVNTTTESGHFVLCVNGVGCCDANPFGSAAQSPNFLANNVRGALRSAAATHTPTTTTTATNTNPPIETVINERFGGYHAAAALATHLDTDIVLEVGCPLPSTQFILYSEIGGKGVIGVSGAGGSVSMMVDIHRTHHAWSFGDCSSSSSQFNAYIDVCVNEMSEMPGNPSPHDVHMRTPTALVEVEGEGGVDVSFLAQ